MQADSFQWNIVVCDFSLVVGADSRVITAASSADLVHLGDAAFCRCEHGTVQDEHEAHADCDEGGHEAPREWRQRSSVVLERSGFCRSRRRVCSAWSLPSRLLRRRHVGSGLQVSGGRHHIFGSCERRVVEAVCVDRASVECDEKR